MDLSRGILYLASKDQYLPEVMVSAQSVRAVAQHLPIALVTPCTVESDYFDFVIDLPDASFDLIDCQRALLRSPFERTFYLDADTYACADFTEVFVLLDNFDFALTPDHNRFSAPLSDVPESYWEYSTGVGLYKSGENTRRILQRCIDLHDQDPDRWRDQAGRISDQVIFRYVSYHEGLAIAPLPIEYNCFVAAWGFLNHPVKIIHGRDIPDHQLLAANLNTSEGPRTFISGRHVPGHFHARLRTRGTPVSDGYARNHLVWLEIVDVSGPLNLLNPLNLIARFWAGIKRRGWIGMIQHIVRRVFFDEH